MRLESTFSSILLLSAAGCQMPGFARGEVQGMRPISFDSAPSGAHVVGHGPGTCDLCDLYYKARIHVVRLSASEGVGTGLVVGESGQFVTNAHVVGSDDTPTVETYEGVVFAAKIQRKGEAVDLALVQLDPPAGTWVPMRVEPAALPEVGSDVYVIGHPVGLGWTITRGIVSAWRKPGEIAPIEMIQTDAAISPGNSGGPLLDRRGRLVGVVVSKLAGPGIESVGFAIPVSRVAAFLGGGDGVGF